ncbi:MAG: class I adenylate-forming enzyme family protein [Gemmatimonadales bacterium]
MTAFRRPHRPLPEERRPPALARISDYPRHWAAADPARIAVRFGPDGWTYGDLADRIDRAARALLALGVRPGDRVATLSPPHPDFLVTFLAAASIGAIWLGLNPRYQLRELEYVVGDAAPSVILARTRIDSRSFAAELRALASGIGRNARFGLLDDPGHGTPPAGATGETNLPGEPFARMLAAGEAVAPAELARAREAVSPDDPCLIVYTSGTTGRPKGAVIRHHGLVHVARVQHAIWPVEPLRVINNLPINHIGCVGDITCDTLVPGGTIVFQEQFDPGAMLAAIPAERITMFGHVPTALQLVVGHPAFDTTDFSSVQLLIWEGAAAPAALIERLRSKCAEVANAYGMTETVGSVTFTFDSDDLEVLADSVGWPVPEYGVRIATESGAPVPPGTPGEIQVKGGFVTSGYWQRDDATRELFTADGWLRTGDLAVERSDGAYRLIGRLKEMFKSGGYNVYPREIELVLERHPGVAMAAVIGVPDPLYQEVGHAFVMARPGAAVDPAGLEAFCRGELANYKVPKRFTVAAEFPMLPIGKIDKQALRGAAR